jgi:oligoribonuclease
MSGLDPETCQILEIATIVTDAELNILAEGPDLVIHWPDSVLEAMDAWCTQHHGESGLTDAVRSSDIPLIEAERQTLAFLDRHCPPGRSPLCGNSVWQDRRFLDRHMPSLGAFLHYRTVDVSTLKELVRRWYPDLEVPPKRESHRALDDIRESIEELRFYRQHVFVPEHTLQDRARSGGPVG